MAETTESLANRGPESQAATYATTFLDSIVENIPDMIFVKDAEQLRFVRFNKAGEELLGYSRDELIGKNDYDFFPKEEADFFTGKDRAVLAGGKMVDIPEEPIHTKHKGKRILHTKKIPILDGQGKPLYLLGISEDITERKNAERELQKAHTNLERKVQERTAQLSKAISELHKEIAERKKAEKEIRRLHEGLEQKVADRTRALTAANQELESFSYSVSHDLRAPLRAVDGFSSLLLSEHASQLDEEGKRMLGIVRKSTLLMSKLIDDLLTFSRISRKGMDRQPVPMKNLVHSVIEDLRTLQELGAVEIVVDALPDAFGDAGMLRQVWTNLLSNAIKFTRRSRRPAVHISGRREEHQAVYCIEDNGVGFDMQYAGKLFGVFQRLHNVDEFEGTGVGLAVVQRVVHKHGGRVWAESKINEGAKFYFALPLNGAAGDVDAGAP